MNLNPDIFSIYWLAIGALFFIVLLLAALRSARWSQLKNVTDLNILIGSIISVMVIWQIHTGLSTVFNMHLVGATLLTLMFGWAFAVLGLSIVIIINTFLQHGSFLLIPWDVLLIATVPVMFTQTLYNLVDRHLPNHFFIYIFVNAFFGAGLSMALIITATTLVQYMLGPWTLEYLEYYYFRYAILIIFPEAFLTGMLMTIFIVYKPEWVSSFDDKRYLHNR